MILRKIGLLCAALAMFSIAGGHWAVLQTVAWGQMLADYTRASGSVVAAVEQTFDGEHPCALCREIQSAKTKEKRGPAVPGLDQDAKVKALVADAVVLPAARVAAEFPFPRTGTAAGPGRTDCPPTPPPRPGRRAA